MIRIAITPPSIDNSTVVKTAAIIEALLTRAAWDRVHLRFPDASKELTAKVIDNIHPTLWPQLTLHDHHQLAAERHTGVQLNSRHPRLTVDRSNISTLSYSCHTIADIHTHAREKDIDYMTLSPIFDSISKKGYRAAGFTTAELHDINNRYPYIIALGGVTPQHTGTLARLGFAGYAVLGALPWQDTTDNIINVAKQFKCSNS